MRRHKDPDGYKEPFMLIDPLNFRSKINLRKRTIALIYFLSLGCIISSINFNHFPQQNSLEAALGMIGGVLFAVAWAGALINALKARRWGWLFFVGLLSPIALLIYSFVGPDAPQAAHDNLLSEQDRNAPLLCLPVILILFCKRGYAASSAKHWERTACIAEACTD